MSSTTTKEVSPDRTIGRGWARFTTVAMAAIFFQSVTAGRILDGDQWARTTHRAVATLLVFALLAAGVVAFAALAAQTNRLARRLADEPDHSKGSEHG